MPQVRSAGLTVFSIRWIWAISTIEVARQNSTFESIGIRPGAELVNFDRRRVRPWTTLDFSTGADFFADERVTIRLQFDIQNLTDHRFAYDFGNPFEGTHFGHPRMYSGRIKFTFR